MSALALTIRPARDTDRNYIVGNWVKEMRHSGFSKHVPYELYWAAQHEHCDRMMSLGQSAVAHNIANDDHLYGAIVWQPARHAILHWLHVKKDFRRLRVARQLLGYAFPSKPPVILCLQAPNATFNNVSLCRALGLVHFPYPMLGITPSKELASWPEPRSREKTEDARP